MLDEKTAWDLLRALSGGRDAAEVAGLAIEPSGAWTAPGPVEEAARDLLDLFLPVALPADLVVGQIGQSLDGRIATRAGHSHYVTGPADIVRLHRLRALVDAVVVGAGTVDLDDPQLTVRRVEGKNPVRVVLDPAGRLDPTRGVFTDGAAPTLVVRARGASGPDLPGVGVIALPADDPSRRFHPARVVEALRERGHRRLLVEGGGVTVSRFLEAGALDRLHVTVAPLLMGSGRPALTLEPIETLDQALRPPCRRVPLGDDVLFDLDLRGAPR